MEEKRGRNKEHWKKEKKKIEHKKNGRKRYDGGIYKHSKAINENNKSQ